MKIKLAIPFIIGIPLAFWGHLLLQPIAKAHHLTGLQGIGVIVTALILYFIFQQLGEE